MSSAGLRTLSLNSQKKKPYDYLKGIILKYTGHSEEERIRDVLQNITIGDKTPAQLLRFMKSQLGSKHVSETVLRTRWMERLPSWVSQIIVPMSRSTALDDLADSADLEFERSNNITSGSPLVTLPLCPLHCLWLSLLARIKLKFICGVDTLIGSATSFSLAQSARAVEYTDPSAEGSV